MNINSDPEGFVRSGNERVLRARFNDARFFWETDQKKSLADRKADLAERHHSRRSSGRTSRNRARDGAGPAIWGGTGHAVRAAELLKCDLTTELVKEFTELQGVVGGLYARAQGEHAEVWQAIYDQYKPESMEDSIPRAPDRAIGWHRRQARPLRGCFGVGPLSTGSRDPFAVRRAAQGIVKILVEGGIEIPLRKFIWRR